MKTSDFYFDLPEELIAQTPLEKRDASRLLCLDKVTGEIQHRVFSELPELLRPGDCLVMNDSRVLPARLLGARESGGAVEVLLLRDLGGGRWECLTRPGRKTRPGTKLVFGDGELEAEVIEVVPCKAEPTVRSTVFAGLPKGERSDFLVQKCTEAGASEIVFFSCTRCVAKAVNMEKKLERWQRIAEEAAKQSGRGIIPQVRYEADFVAVLNDALHTDLPLFMYETGERETIRDAIEHTASPIASAAIITGPEGGFAEFEADMARKLGMHICSMGERILRCETAPVVALTALMYGTGNL